MKVCNVCKKELESMKIISLSYMKETFLTREFISKEFCSHECLTDFLITGKTITMLIQKVTEPKNES